MRGVRAGRTPELEGRPHQCRRRDRQGHAGRRGRRRGRAGRGDWRVLCQPRVEPMVLRGHEALRVRDPHAARTRARRAGAPGRQRHARARAWRALQEMGETTPIIAVQARACSPIAAAFLAHHDPRHTRDRLRHRRRGHRHRVARARRRDPRRRASHARRLRHRDRRRDPVGSERARGARATSSSRPARRPPRPSAMSTSTTWSFRSQQESGHEGERRRQRSSSHTGAWSTRNSLTARHRSSTSHSCSSLLKIAASDTLDASHDREAALGGVG